MIQRWSQRDKVINDELVTTGNKFEILNNDEPEKQVNTNDVQRKEPHSKKVIINQQ